MLQKTAIVLSLTAAAVLSAGRTWETVPSGQKGDWRTYKQPAFGYEISYPAGWKVVEAAPKKSDQAQWEGDVLLDDEVQKTTFLETPYGLWQGQFQVSVEAVPEGLGIEEWLKKNEPRDITGGSLVQGRSDVTVDGKPGVRLSVFGFDHEEILVVFLRGRRLFHFGFAGRNPNDPEAAAHSAVYDRMLASFRLTD